MKKSPFLFLLVLGILLASCVPATTMPSFVDETEAPVATEAPVQPQATEPAPATESTAPAATEAAVAVGPAACVAGISILPTPDATQAALAAGIPPVTDADWIRGNPNAKFTILEYSDFMCPYCAALSPVLEQLMAQYPDDIRQVFRHFPLPSHPLSLLGTQAAEAAGLQGKFWEVTDYLLLNQSEWSTMDLAGFETYLLGKAESWGLDKAKFTSDLKSSAIIKKAQDAADQAGKAGITYTPFVMLNDRVLQGNELQSLDLIIRLLDSQENNYTECPPSLLNDSKSYSATIETESGNIVIELFADKAPLAVNSFVFLAQEGWYDNRPFNEIIRDTAENGFQLAIAGDHTGTGYGSAGYQIGLENADAKYDRKGLVGLVNGSQFFLTMSAQPALDGRFTQIGEIVEGMDILESLPVTATAEGMIAPGVKILKISITEK